MSNIFSTKNIIIAILVLVILWLAMCNKKTEPDAPAIIPVETQKEVIKRDEEYTKHVIDSINKNVVNPALESADKWKDNFIKEQKNGIEQANIFNDMLNSFPPDTSKKLLAKFNELKEISDRKDKSFLMSITQNELALRGKDAIIKIKDEQYDRLKGYTDTCFKQQKALENYVEKLQPRRKIYLGATVMGNKGDFFSGIGGNIGYKSKKDDMVEVGVMFMQGLSVTQITIGIRKPLFSF